MHLPNRLFLSRVPLLTVILFASGCATIDYYSQAVSGQLEILSRTRNISDLLDDSPSTHSEPQHSTPTVNPDVKARLTTVLQIRDFATQSLALPDNGSYRVYADLDRPQVAWNVVATAEFSLAPKEWCFPIAGCVPYRGYFSQENARQFAASLRDERLDVRVVGVAAYSTLGWFRDPVFSTQLQRSDTDLAALIFHELAHQQLYLNGDAAFNESFATAVEIEGMRRWLAQDKQATGLDDYLRDVKRQQDFVELLQKYRAQLETLYAAPIPADQMRADKAHVFAALKLEYAQLRQEWGGYNGYDAWFAQDLNNAHLASIGLYHRYVPAFQKLLATTNGDLPRFYQLADSLSRLPENERAAQLNDILNRQTFTPPANRF